MKKLAWIALCGLLWAVLGAGAFLPVASAAAPDLQPLLQTLDARVPGWLQRYHTPGAVIALVHGGEVAWVQGYGWADRENRQPMTANTVFGVASISKPVTAWGVMKLVEAGRVGLDDPLARYVTRWQLPAGGFDPQGVTIRRLLSHSAGLSTPEYIGYLEAVEPLPSVEEALSGQDGGVYLQSEPGQAFAYTDGGYLLLQVLIEEVTGRSFVDYMQQEVLDPLGLPASSFDENLARQPSGTGRLLVTSYDDFGRRLPNYRYVEKAPASLHMTAGELAGFVAAAMPGPQGQPPGRGVLRPETVALMLQPQIKIGGFDRYIYAKAYGLGYFLETLPDGRLAASHMGGNIGGVSEFVALPEQGDAVVILTNSLAGHEFFAEVMAAWTDWLGSGQAVLGGTIRLARAILAAWAGMMAGGALLLLASAWRRLRNGHARLSPPWRQPRPGRAWLSLILPLLALALYAWLVYPFFHISMPSQSTPLLVGVTGLCLALVAWGLTTSDPA